MNFMLDPGIGTGRKREAEDTKILSETQEQKMARVREELEKSQAEEIREKHADLLENAQGLKKKMSETHERIQNLRTQLEELAPESNIGILDDIPENAKELQGKIRETLGEWDVMSEEFKSLSDEVDQRTPRLRGMLDSLESHGIDLREREDAIAKDMKDSYEKLKRFEERLASGTDTSLRGGQLELGVYLGLKKEFDAVQNGTWTQMEPNEWIIKAGEYRKGGQPVSVPEEFSALAEDFQRHKDYSRTRLDESIGYFDDVPAEIEKRKKWSEESHPVDDAF